MRMWRAGILCFGCLNMIVPKTGSGQSSQLSDIQGFYFKNITTVHQNHSITGIKK